MNRCLRWIVGGLVLLGGGCWSSPVSPTIHDALVRGVVTLNGRPLSHGTVTFLPVTESQERVDPGIARIEPDGSFWIGNANLSKPAGIQPGRYKVTILVMNPRAPDETGPPARLGVPEVYTDPSTTPYEFDVIKGQNRFRLDITSTP